MHESWLLSLKYNFNIYFISFRIIEGFLRCEGKRYSPPGHRNYKRKKPQHSLREPVSFHDYVSLVQRLKLKSRFAEKVFIFH